MKVGLQTPPKTTGAKGKVSAKVFPLVTKNYLLFEACTLQETGRYGLKTKCIQYKQYYSVSTHPLEFTTLCLFVFQPCCVCVHACVRV